MTELMMPDGSKVVQGSTADQSTWWTCGVCEFIGPHVGSNPEGKPACQGSCGGTTLNPNAPRLEGYVVPDPSEPPEGIPVLVPHQFLEDAVHYTRLFEGGGVANAVHGEKHRDEMVIKYPAVWMKWLCDNVGEFGNTGEY